MNICFVHAHPDDETLATGALIAHLAARDHGVFVLTATRGEMGDVVPGPLSRLAGTQELEIQREQELAAALRVLGVTGSAFLGDRPARAELPERHYLDSGMRWVTPQLAGPAEHASERSLCAADEGEVVADLSSYLRAVGAHLAVSYDADGGYGHPDHVALHHLTRRAAGQVGAGFAVIRSEPGEGVRWFDLENLLPVVIEALGHHRTQLTVSGSTVTHSGGQREAARASVGLKGALPR